MSAVVRVEQLRRSYGDVEAVRGISFEVQRGEVFGLLGPNGAGKTTTIEILEGFRDRSGGVVEVLGLDPARRADLRELRRRVGVVLQQTGHYRFLSVRETLEMHHAYHQDPRPVAEVLELVGLVDAAERRVRELSGGQQRRLDVGVALVGRPELVFLDEPTTGFDPAARRRAWDMVAGLRDLGTTVVLTTHYMEEAQALVDRVAVICEGRIVGSGTPAELARQLQLGSTVTFALPGTMGLGDLPAEVAAAAAMVEGAVMLRCADPAPVLATLCTWAVEHGITLTALEVRAPSLEDSYLTLTRPGLVPGAPVEVTSASRLADAPAPAASSSGARR